MVMKLTVDSYLLHICIIIAIASASWNFLLSLSSKMAGKQWTKLMLQLQYTCILQVLIATENNDFCNADRAPIR